MYRTLILLCSLWNVMQGTEDNLCTQQSSPHKITELPEEHLLILDFFFFKHFEQRNIQQNNFKPLCSKLLKFRVGLACTGCTGTNPGGL